MVKRREVLESEKIEWERLAQMACLSSLSAASPWKVNDFVFHGGTSLHLSWQSSRGSEDLDFMIRRALLTDLPKTMEKVFAHMTEMLQGRDPDFRVRVKEKSRRDGNLASYMIVVEKENVFGSAHVKLEFWGVENDFLKSYGTTFKIPTDPFFKIKMGFSTPIPVAELKSAYCDKMVALSTRPYLKWRDLYDIWWLRTQKNINPIHDKDFLPFFKHNLTAYSVPDGMTLEQSLDRYLTWDRKAVLKSAETDLKKWLPEPTWNLLYPHGVEQMMNCVEEDVKSLIALLSHDHAPKTKVSP